MPTTILSEAGEAQVQPLHGRADGTALWLAPADLTAATGWTIRSEGLCRGPVCVPVPPGKRDSFVRDDAVNVAAFWRQIGAPLAASDGGDVWVLGEEADSRAQQLESLEAPDFSLPDREGRQHRLSDFRGQKVFLATWASW